MNSSLRVLDLTGYTEVNDPQVEVLRLPDSRARDVTEKVQVVVAASELVFVEFARYVDVLTQWANRLNEGGRLYLYMPSMEWLAREVLGGRIQSHLIAHLYGSPERPMRSIVTLAGLNELILRAGLVVIEAGTEQYQVGEDEMGRKLMGERHRIVALKPHASDGNGSRQWTPD